MTRGGAGHEKNNDAGSCFWVGTVVFFFAIEMLFRRPFPNLAGAGWSNGDFLRALIFFILRPKATLVE